MTLDLNADTDYPAFTFTFTSSTDFLPSQEDQLVQWHKKRSSFCLLVQEFHDDGRRHYHSVIAAPKPRDTSGWTRACATLYKAMDIEVVKGITYRVKKETDRVGWFHYLLKTQKGNPLFLRGWTYSWIKEQCKANVKKMPHKILCKEVVVLSKATASQSVLKYAEATGQKLTGKISFANCVADMINDKYIFSGVSYKHVYSEVMVQSGNRTATVNMVLGELHFLDD